MRMKRSVLLAILLFLLQAVILKKSQALSLSDSIPATVDSAVKVPDCIQKDVFDILFKKRNAKPRPQKRVTFLGIPYVSYSPVTDFQLGIGGTISWRIGDPVYTNLSAATVSGIVTTKRQLIIQVKTNVYTNKNKWFLQGDWRYYIFKFNTYGLGTDIGYAVPSIPEVTPSPESKETTVYPMDFNWLKIHQVVTRKITESLYGGLGYHLDIHTRIEDLELKLDTPGVLVTPHYAYCQLENISPYEYASSGISLNLIYDTRDNIINPFKGYYVNFNFRQNFKFLGSTQSGSQLWMEFRTYIGLSKRLPRHLIGFWTYGSFNTGGTIPFLDLPSTGFDQMNISGRGYIQGRWRGENLMYGEVEYRFPISQCSQVLGGVFFANVTTASNKEMGTRLFQYFRAAAGIGIRVMVSKKNRINLMIDVGWGERSDGVYVTAQEAF